MGIPIKCEAWTDRRPELGGTPAGFDTRGPPVLLEGTLEA
jgi:hypothetical protein